ncbi:MAG TPA: DUF2946 domain-containing protein [Xanthobacteraceae bacterium]
MRRRLGRFLPIVMFAVLVQILAPIAACWAVSDSLSDPLAGAICSHLTDTTSPQGGQSDPQQSHGSCCMVCCAAHTATPTADPQSSFSKLERTAAAVVWFEQAPALQRVGAASNAQARGPPVIS